tara:strand:+ start:216 stop:362 length:147 start_codon:yes stop_codon:yes gene_type:complete
MSKISYNSIFAKCGAMEKMGKKTIVKYISLINYLKKILKNNNKFYYNV